jgi:hypothetical protein
MGKFKNESAVLFEKFRGIRYGEKLVDERTVSKWIAQKESEGVDWMQLVQHSVRRQCSYKDGEFLGWIFAENFTLGSKLDC